MRLHLLVLRILNSCNLEKPTHILWILPHYCLNRQDPTLSYLLRQFLRRIVVIKTACHLYLIPLLLVIFIYGHWKYLQTPANNASFSLASTFWSFSSLFADSEGEDEHED